MYRYTVLVFAGADHPVACFEVARRDSALALARAYRRMGYGVRVEGPPAFADP